MKTLNITMSETDVKLADVIACIPLPESCALPEQPLMSWQDFITWLLENPEIIAQFIAALIMIFAPGQTPRKNT